MLATLTACHWVNAIANNKALDSTRYTLVIIAFLCGIFMRNMDRIVNYIGIRRRTNKKNMKNVNQVKYIFMTEFAKKKTKNDYNFYK